MDVFDRMGNVSHPDEEYLERYVMKSCTDRENLDIEEHLQICEHCHSRFHQAEEWVALMKIAIPLGPMPSRASPSGWRLSVERLLSKPLVAAGYAAVAIALCASPLLMLRNRFAGEEVVLLAATRGGADSGPPTASSRNRLRLRIDTTDLDGPLEAQIVDASGTTVASSTLAASNPEVVLDHKLEPGSYWVRVNSSVDHRTLRETGLRVQ
jgi:hypothetical protein